MGYDRPTGSITGQEDWDWNRWRRNHDETGAASRTAPTDRNARGTHEVVPRDAIADLESDLGRSERRFRSVLRQYERLLSERNRQLAEEQSDGGAERTLAERARSLLSIAGDP